MVVSLGTSESLMASAFCKSTLRISSSFLANRSKSFNLLAKSPACLPSVFSSPSSTAIPRASRVLSVLGSIESMMPLHSATATARLTSSIAVDSSCWSWLSRVPR